MWYIEKYQISLEFCTNVHDEMMKYKGGSDV